MTPEETRKIVHDTVMETFGILGLDVGSPIAVQEDMAWLRKARQGSEEVRKWTLKAFIGSLVTGLCFLIWRALHGN